MTWFKITCPFCRKRVPISSIRCPECRSLIPWEYGDLERRRIFIAAGIAAGVLVLCAAAAAAWGIARLLR